MILAQYRPHSLIEHIGAGGPWDLNRDFTGGVRIYSPYKARGSSDWYLGTADAVQQNFRFIKNGNPDLVLILSGDHIYQMNYDALITFHLDHGADLTIASIRVPMHDASRFGILKIGDDYQVVSFSEKPPQPASNLVNMGVYVFSLDLLDRVLWEDRENSNSSHDFGKDIIPQMIDSRSHIIAYPFTGYWVDVGTVYSYWQAHMDLLVSPPPIDLNDRSWIIHTRTEERPPVWLAKGAAVMDSMLSGGCEISERATIDRCVLSPGVRVHSNAVVRNSVILTDTIIEAGALIENAIIDKHVVIGKDSRIGGEFGADESAIAMVGKNSIVPPHFNVQPGAIIATDVIDTDYSSKTIRGEDYIQTKRLPYEV